MEDTAPLVSNNDGKYSKVLTDDSEKKCMCKMNKRVI